MSETSDSDGYATPTARNGDHSEFQGRSRSSQARSHDFVHEGSTLRVPKVPPTKNGKLLGFGPLFFGSGQFALYFLVFTIKFYFIFLLRIEHGPRAPSPCLRPWVQSTTYQDMVTNQPP